MQAKHILIFGRVQGVGFRYFTYREARKCGVHGWARNLEDGRTVEVFAQGEAERLARFLEKVEKGPIFSKVLEVKTNAAQPDQNLESFNIRYGWE